MVLIFNFRIDCSFVEIIKNVFVIGFSFSSLTCTERERRKKGWNYQWLVHLIHISKQWKLIDYFLRLTSFRVFNSPIICQFLFYFPIFSFYSNRQLSNTPGHLSKFLHFLLLPCNIFRFIWTTMKKVSKSNIHICILRTCRTANDCYMKSEQRAHKGAEWWISGDLLLYNTLFILCVNTIFYKFLFTISSLISVSVYICSSIVSIFTNVWWIFRRILFFLF